MNSIICVSAIGDNTNMSDYDTMRVYGGNVGGAACGGGAIVLHTSALVYCYIPLIKLSINNPYICCIQYVVICIFVIYIYIYIYIPLQLQY